MSASKEPEKNSPDAKKDRLDVTSQIAFEDEASRLERLAEKTARLRALRKAYEAKGK